MIRAALVLVLTLPLLACGGDKAMTAKLPPEPAHRIMETALGRILATNRGMALYTFANDAMFGMSMCNDECSRNWPPLLALDDALPTGKWSVVQRSDGLKQWAYGGKPLYGWHEDRAPGIVRGDGRANGAWSVARP